MEQTKNDEKNMKGANKIVYIKTINVYIPPRTRYGLQTTHKIYFLLMISHVVGSTHTENTETQ